MQKPTLVNSLVEHQIKIRNSKITTQFHHHQHHQITNLNSNSNSKLNATSSANHQWHWQHYHLPYKFGSKKPQFHDYDHDDLDDYGYDDESGKTTNNLGATTDSDHLAQLSCDSGEMILRLNFSEPFKGIVYPGHDRLSPCRFFGDGHHNYELRLPLRGCGTRQTAPRFFVNDVVVRFHKTLELEEDEVKTLICRYPPPAPATPQVGTGSGELFQRTAANGSRTNQDVEPPAFELFDPSSGLKPVLKLPGEQESDPTASGNIETLSENLVVSPSSVPGLENQHSSLGRPQMDKELGYLPAATMGQLKNKSAQLQNQRQPPPAVITADLFEQPTSNKQTDSTFFERLSSLQLLFLISSVMFLLLVSLGLGFSYYCFRRHQSSQRRRMRAAGIPGNERASAILKRKQRHYATPIMVTSSNSPIHYATQHHHLHHKHNQNHQHHIALPPPSSQTQILVPQIRAVTDNKHLLQGPIRSSSGSSSSPESDLSARQLLAESQQQLNNSNNHYAAFNRAYVPEMAQTDLLNAYASRPGYTRYPTNRRYHAQPVLGRRNANIYSTGATEATPGRAYQDPSRYSADKHSIYQPQEPLLNQMKQKNEQVKYSMVKKRDPHLYWAQQIYVGAPEAPETNLWRAKSLSSVQQHQQQQLHHQQQQQQYQAATLVKKPVNYQRNITSNRIDESLTKEKMLDAATNKPGRLVLKSIEDSYITNFTEIYEQEYMKRDSTRPLSMAEWRQMQPVKRNLTKSPATNSSSDTESEPDETNSHQMRNNLRSLTELDVNFAKSSLLMAVNPDQSKPNNSNSNLNSKSNTLGRTDERTKLERASESLLNRSNSMPDVGPEIKQKLGFAREDSKGNQVLENNVEEETLSSPDLILSPDYEHSQESEPLRRVGLELVEPNGSISSHNSVSYV